MSCCSTKIVFTYYIMYTKQQGGEKYDRSIINYLTAHKPEVLTLCGTYSLPMCFPNMVM